MTDPAEFVIDGLNLDCSIRESERDAGVNCRWLNAWSFCESLVSSASDPAVSIHGLRRADLLCFRSW